MAGRHPDPVDRDAHFLRRSFEVARRAMKNGNHPFGAVLVDGDGNVLIEAENGYMPSHDGTAHAERLLATQACTSLDALTLRGAHDLFFRQALLDVDRMPDQAIKSGRPERHRPCPAMGEIGHHLLANITYVLRSIAGEAKLANSCLKP